MRGCALVFDGICVGVVVVRADDELPRTLLSIRCDFRVYGLGDNMWRVCVIVCWRVRRRDCVFLVGRGWSGSFQLRL